MDIGVVLVTFNRINDLKVALKKYEDQIKQPKYIVVVNNNSTDGTFELLQEWKEEKAEFNKYVINLEKNIGGSGGFYTGLKESLELDADWIWVADDDAYPEEDALSKIEEFYDKNNIKNRNDVSAICATVINHGQVDVGHRRRVETTFLKVKDCTTEVSEYKNNDYIEINIFSYVGSVINKEHLKKAGLTDKDLFIFCDDTEHSYRLSKTGKIFCVSNSKVIHDSIPMKDGYINWKEYYMLRNKLFFIKRDFNWRYFFLLYNKLLIKCLIKKISNPNDTLNNVKLAALKDAKNDVKGLHAIYKPGWKSK